MRQLTRHLKQNSSLGNLRIIVAVSCIVLEEIGRILMGHGVRKMVESLDFGLLPGRRLDPVPIRLSPRAQRLRTR